MAERGICAVDGLRTTASLEDNLLHNQMNQITI
jgi:hypothetical protein